LRGTAAAASFAKSRPSDRPSACKETKKGRLFLHLQRIQRPFDPTIAMMDVLQQIYLLREVDEDSTKTDLPDKLLKMDKVREVIESIEIAMLSMKAIN
jgi:hypothetical protein